MMPSTDVTEIIKARSSVPDESFITASQWKNMQYCKLGRDYYCPGLIQDAADSNCNFNATAIKLLKDTFGEIPKDPGSYIPYSLLEIFNRRIEEERKNMKYFMGSSLDNINSDIDTYFQQKMRNDTNRAIASLLKVELAYKKGNSNDKPKVDLNISVQDISLPDHVEAVTCLGFVSANSK